MKVELVSVSESISLDDGSTSHSVFVELPGQVLIELQADDQVVAAILRAAGAAADPPVPAVEPVHRPVEFAKEMQADILEHALVEVRSELAAAQAADPTQPVAEERVSVPALVDWQALPDDVLAPKIKEVLKGVKAPPQMAYEELLRVAKNVTEMLQRQSGVGQVQWEGDRQSAPRRNVPPQRTVDRDDFGYPIVERKGDDGQSQVGDKDEDGVPQL